MRNIEIIVDNFRIGGIQRLALDQAYALSSNGENVTIIVLSLEPSNEVASFIHNEKVFIENLNIKIEFFQESKYQQIRRLFMHLKQRNPDLIISHSLRGTVLIYLCKKFFEEKPIVVTIIHQLLSMSAPNQRVKRILYSQFTDILFAYSVAVKNDWEHRRKHNPFIWLISYHKKISVCKNGVYLPRIKFNQTELLSKNNKNKRFIFVSRLAAWKGLSKVINIIEAKEFEKTNLLIVSPDDPMSYLADVDQEVKKRISSVIGKSVSQIQFYRNDLHIYPATYGPTNRYIESISINVLEMACFGVKSFVTKNGVETWPDLAKLGMIFEVDWSDLPSAIRTILENDAPAGVSEIAKARELIDIQNHLNQIYCAAGFDKLN